MMLGKKREKAPRDNIEAAKMREIERRSGANFRALKYLRKKRRPKNASADIHERTEGRKARDWPVLDTEWLEDFPDFPFHLDGLRCCYVGNGPVNCSVYVSPKDSDVIQDLVLLADCRLDQAFDEWPLPEFGHTVPNYNKRAENTVIWPANYAKLRMRPFTRNGRPSMKPFAVEVRTPVWRDDGLFDESILEVTLDASCAPIYIASEYRVHSKGARMNNVIVNSSLDDDGEWRFHWVRSDVPRHRKTYVDPADG